MVGWKKNMVINKAAWQVEKTTIAEGLGSDKLNHRSEKVEHVRWIFGAVILKKRIFVVCKSP